MGTKALRHPRVKGGREHDASASGALHHSSTITKTLAAAYFAPAKSGEEVSEPGFFT
jgi:hypothetical protein